MARLANFTDRLISAIEDKESCVVVGLDPRLSSIPASIREDSVRKHGQTFQAIGDCFLEFNKRIIDATVEHAVAVKLQIAFYEQYGHTGIMTLEETVAYAKAQNLVVIVDAKRNDIGSTAEAYAKGYLGQVPTWNGRRAASFDVDAITVNPYLGVDGVVVY